mmetsp:Transcript_35840/g.86667  ORF Transcript_35840/g.86667 Transcript_35840/m.86667 type:complete len:213 (+) Transcript_35840:196-834(+)
MKFTTCTRSLFAAFLLAQLSNNECAVALDKGSSLSIRRMSVVAGHDMDDDDTSDTARVSDGDDEAVSSSSVSTSTGHGGFGSGTMDDDFSNLSTTTSTTASDSTTIANATSSNSTDVTSGTSSTSNETTPALDEQPTETPTLTVEELISLMDDDSIQNVTSFIPPEKQEPKEWAGEVILFFVIGALVLFAATGIKQCRKRRTYSEIPTSLVV